MRKKILLMFVLLFCIINFDVKALTYGGCDVSLISKLKSYVTNINISYSYYISGNVPYFKVIVNNVTPDMYFVDSVTGKVYTYQNTDNGEITISGYIQMGGRYDFYSANNECYGTKLGTKYFSFPKYNFYHESDLCSDIPDFGLCKRWTTVGYSQIEFQKKIKEYKDSLIPKKENLKIKYDKTWFDYIASFYVKYYYVFLITIILVCGAVILIDKKKNRFKL